MGEKSPQLAILHVQMGAGVLDDLRCGSGGERDDGHAGARSVRLEGREKLGEPGVVGSEVVAPLRDTVSL